MPIGDVQGASGVTGTNTVKKIPIEAIMLMLMMQQCEKKSETLKADKAELDDLTKKMNRAGQLLKKINDASGKVGATSTSAVSTKLSDSEINDINLLIKELGITTLFNGEMTVPSPRMQQETALKSMFSATNTADRTVNADWWQEFQAEFNTANGLPITTITTAPTDAQLEKFYARVLPADVNAPLNLPLTKLGSYTSTQLANSKTALQNAYKSRLDPLKASAVTVKGVLQGTNTGRDLSSAATMMQTELQVIGTQHSSAMTKTNDDLGVQNNFLQAARAFIEELLKLSSGTIQRF